MRPDHPSTLVLFVTSRCNCRCSFCFNLENVIAGKKEDELTLVNIKKIARSMRPLTQIVMSGGEPFLRRDLTEIVHAFYSLSGTRQITIPTNGALPDRIPSMVQEMLETCPNLFLNINISIDGIGEDHDRARELPGCFDKLSETCHQLEEIRETQDRLAINVQTVVMRQNASKIMDVVRYIQDNFRVNYHALGLVRGDVGEQEHDYDLREAEAVVDAHYLREGGVRNTLPVFNAVAPSALSLIRKIQFEAEQTQTRSFKCLAGRKLVVISDEGNLMACEPLAFEEDTRGGRDADDFIMARLPEYDFDVRKALASPRAQEIKQFVAQKRCWCIYGCAIQNSITYSPKMYPRLAREILRQRSQKNVST